MRRTRRLRAVEAAARIFAPSLVLAATALPASANDGLHGFVDPCAVSFVEDNTTECELCAPPADDADACKKKLAPHGYQLKCRATPGHSQPGEVWCRPRPGFSLPRAAQPPAPPPSRDWYVGIPVAGAVALGALWFVKRRSSKTKRRSKSAPRSH